MYLALVCKRQTYLLLPMASIACHGGPMNTSPASVHLRANAEFSLNYGHLSEVHDSQG